MATFSGRFSIASLALAALALSGVLGHASAAAADASENASERQVRDVGHFSEVEFSGAGTLQILVGAEPSVVVQAPPELIDVVRTEVRGERLHIVCEAAPCGRIHVSVETPRLRAIETNGSPMTRVVGRIEEGSFLAATHGSGRIHIDTLDVEELEAEIAGSGRVEAAGRAERLRLLSAGSGDLRLARLASETARVRLAGSGDADLHVQKALHARIAGSGSIELTGQPGTIAVSTYGTGRLTQR